MTIYRGDTVRIEMIHYDYDGETLITPDSWSIKFYDPDDKLKATYTSPTLFTSDAYPSGRYYQTHNIAATDKTGAWKCRWSATAGASTDTEEVTFTVNK